MTFRTKLFAIFTLALLLCVAMIAAGVSQITRRAYDQTHTEYAAAAVSQYQQQLERERTEVLQKVEVIADAEGTVRMAIDISRPQTDLSIYANDARGVSRAHHLDFLDFVSSDGSVISSAGSSAHAGSKLTWVTQQENWAAVGGFLMKIDTQEGPVLGFVAVSTVRVGDKNLYVVGGQRIGKEFLTSVALPAGIRGFIYENLTPSFQPTNLISDSAPVNQLGRLAPFIDSICQQPREETFKINWTSAASSAEQFHALPLLGRQKNPLGVLLVGNSLADVITLESRVRQLALGVVAIGIFLGILMSAWSAARVTRPVLAIAESAKAVANDNWGARVHVRGPSEIRTLATAFNQMTQHLTEQREKLLQAERVASWREVAGRVSEQSNAVLQSLQIEMDELTRAEGTQAGANGESQKALAHLSADVEKLTSIVRRFRMFSESPEIHVGPVNLNDLVRDVLKHFEPEFSALGRPPISSELHLDASLPIIQADANLLHRGLENLVLNAMDAMPSGGVLMLRTTHQDGYVQLEVSDTGDGLTPEQSSRLFGSEEKARKYGSELTLAIVQSIVADHGGRISTETEPDVGTSFHIYLPSKPPANTQSTISEEHHTPVSEGVQPHIG